jgi:putative hydrolase of the HAD superfamily
VVFDIGGVLELTPRTGWEKGWEEQLELGEGGLSGRLGNVWRDGDVGKISEEEMEQRTAEILGLDREQLDAFLKDLWDEYCGTLNAELVEYFASLRPRYKTAIISNSFVGARRIEHDRYGFGDLCDMIVYSHEVGFKKPDPRIFLLACEQLGIQPEEMIFLDDVEVSVVAARELSIKAVHFKNNAQAIEEIEGLLRADGGL